MVGTQSLIDTRCVIDRATGELRCDNPNEEMQPLRAPAPPGRAWSQVLIGTTMLCALDNQGDVWCDGVLHCSQADERVASRECEPRRFGDHVDWLAQPQLHPTDMHDVDELGGGGTSLCVRRGQRWTCDGLLGDSDGPTNIQPPDGSRVVTVTASNQVMCLRTDSLRVYCMGDGSYGQLGVEAMLTGPLQRISPISATQIALSDEHGCFIDEDKHLHCWGTNELGQIPGVPLGEDQQTPVRWSGHQVTSVAVGTAHTCVLLEDRTVRCWGGQWSCGAAGCLVDLPFEPQGIAAGGWQMCAWGQGQARCIGDLAPDLSPQSQIQKVVVAGGDVCVSDGRNFRCWSRGEWSDVVVDTEITDIDGGGPYACARSGDDFVCNRERGFRSNALPDPVSSVWSVSRGGVHLVADDGMVHTMIRREPYPLRCDPIAMDSSFDTLCHSCANGVYCEGRRRPHRTRDWVRLY